MYGNALSSINALRVGPKVGGKGDGVVSGVNMGEEKGVEEGGEGDGEEAREGLGVPQTADARKKWFLIEENKKSWEWEGGRVYWGDFFNPYLDFNGSSHSLPTYTQENQTQQSHARNRFLHKTPRLLPLSPRLSRRRGFAKICAQKQRNR